MLAGLGEAVISPPPGTVMAGYAAREGVSLGVHDDLYARVLYVEEGDEAAAVVVLDVLGVDSYVRSRVAPRVASVLGVPEDRVVVAATHTHSGPDLMGSYSGSREKAVDIVVKGAEEAAEKALESTFRVERVLSAVGECQGVVVNRRKPRGGLVDPRVHVVRLVGEHRVFLLNFSCHVAVLGPNNLLVSADYPGAFVSHFSRLVKCKALFLNGACGDVNPLTEGTDLSRVYDRTVGTFDDVDYMGRVLSEVAYRSL